MLYSGSHPVGWVEPKAIPINAPPRWVSPGASPGSTHPAISNDLERTIDRHKQRLDRHLDDWQRRMPGRVGRAFGWLRRPAVRWLRIPLALLLIAGGLVGFLPVVGFWMIPLGLLLLALDVPGLRRPMHGVVVRIKRWLRNVRRRYRAARR